MHLVKVNYFYKSKSNRAEGALYFPLLRGVWFKPIRVTINDAILNGNFKNSNSSGGARHRKKKNELISNHFKETRDNIYKMKTKYDKHGNISITTFLGMLNGYSSNKSGSIFIDAENTAYDGQKIGELFRGLEKIQIEAKNLEEITFEKLAEIKAESIDSLRKNND